jgi:hypothetical protein
VISEGLLIGVRPVPGGSSLGSESIHVSLFDTA